MKLELTLDEVSACAMALLSKAQAAEEEALGCEKLRCASAAEFWQKRAELYRKTFEAVKAQRASWWEEEQGEKCVDVHGITEANRLKRLASGRLSASAVAKKWCF